MFTPRRLATALVCVGCLALVGCGSSGDDEADTAGPGTEDRIGSSGATDAGGDGDDGGDDSDDGDLTSSDGDDTSADAGAGVQPPIFVLTGGVEAPAGWVEDPANCGGEESGPPYFTYHVPPEWVRRGSGYAGSGGASGSGDHSYELPDGTNLEIEVDTDEYIGTEPASSAGPEPWKTWDYDITAYTDAGEETTRAVYEELDPMEIDGETFDLWYLDQGQDDLIYLSEYKLRATFADVPTGGAAGRDRRPYSATVTFSWDAGSGQVDEAVVRDVLATFRVPTCAQEALVSMFETLNGVTWSD